MKFRRLSYSLIALILATNYLAFQAELFDDEYEANHPKRADKPCITVAGLNWESFDKDTAPQAFTFDAGLRTEFLFPLPSLVLVEFVPFESFKVIRDKSPPSFFLS